MGLRKKVAGSSERSAMDVVPPWCLPRQTYFKVCEVVPQAYFARMRLYFEFYGCMICRTKNPGSYCSCGICQLCMGRLRGRLLRCGRVLAKRERAAVEPLRTEMLKRIRSARALLADLKAYRVAGFKARHGRQPPRVITLRFR